MGQSMTGAHLLALTLGKQREREKIRGRKAGHEFYLLRTPPRREALRHSGGESLLCTSPTVTLYLEVELRRERRPGTEQKTSLGFVTPPIRPSLFIDRAEMVVPFAFEGMGTGRKGREREETVTQSA